ncbi:hypothetical protein [Roseofilum casamattae]|uniref:Uncharacterized protein n=1 Tax=Roseofilum casamattae BLCC-M143 TaxID=3022442 RepID=A0ABT7BWP6_9CYAN|nr:hypothetical protein [Roseofilum casamattae]MDJ1182886.1 hypothetical protein [Roseofilum casamattae BLCC-M143]
MMQSSFPPPEFNSFLEEFVFLQHCLDLMATLELEKLELEARDRPEESRYSLESYLYVQNLIAEKLT